MRIGFAYNQRPNDIELDEAKALSSLSSVDEFIEWDDPETINAVADALAIFGDVILLEAIDDFPLRLQRAHVDLLFNLAEGLNGPSRESHVPAVADFLRVPYVGSGPLAAALTLHKGHAKEVWTQRGVPTAPFVWVESEADLPALERTTFYPLFLKPAWEGSSKGIAQNNLVTTPADAVERARQLLAAYAEPVLAEAYLAGDEFTVAVMGNGASAECLPLIRYRFEALPDDAVPIMGYEAKWLWDAPDAPLVDLLECPARVPDPLAQAIEKTALAAYRALGCRDWARVDLRLDGANRLFVLEINPLPGLMPDPVAHSCFPCAAAAAGMSYAELIQRAVQIAWRRITGHELMIEMLAGAAT